MTFERKIILFTALFILPIILFAQPKAEDSNKGIFLPNQWTLRPAGTSVPVGDLPIGITISPDGKYAVVVHSGYGIHEIRVFDVATHKQTDISSTKNIWLGSAFTPDGKKLYVSGGADDVIHQYDFNKGKLTNPTPLQISYDTTKIKVMYPGGIAVDNKGESIFVAGQYGNSLLQFSIVSSQPQAITFIEFKDDHSYPYKVVLHPNGKTAYVSLWGGKAVGVVNLVDKTYQLVSTDSHPNDLVLSKDGALLYVACANSNGVNIIDTKVLKVIEKLNGALFPDMPPGSTPNGLALSPDQKTLLIANADNNNLAVFDVSKKGSAKSLGFIPTGWYPTGVAFSLKKEILVTNGKGNGSLSNPDGPKPGIPGRQTQYIGGLMLGSLSFISQPDSDELAKYTKDAYLCSPLHKDLMPVGYEKGNPIPAKVGDPSPIKYCVYIIKENRTYDQIFGDIKEGNGDPNLCLFGEEVTPNLHKIVKDYVLLDNFYAEAEVSADGHEWSMGAYATDFVEKTWPVTYGGHGNRKISYKSEGTDPVNDSDSGHLWTKAKEAGITYRSYGEWIHDSGPEGKGFTNDEALVGHFNPYYTGFNMDYSDFDRFKQFKKEFVEFEKNGDLPKLIILKLPNDHTSGTARGKKTPRAYVAENDQVVGMTLELLSNSKFWKEMAVFIVEDDAQNGSDHVDAHRTEALVISPYVKRNHVDHHIYSTASMLRTMELILGLKPMSQFDAGALPMYASFTSEPNVEPYKLEEARISVTEINGERAPMQKESSLLDFQKEDSNPDIFFNEIIWKSVKGENSVMPAPVRAAFVKPVQDKSDKADD